MLHEVFSVVGGGEKVANLWTLMVEMIPLGGAIDHKLCECWCCCNNKKNTKKLKNSYLCKIWRKDLKAYASINSCRQIREGVKKLFFGRPFPNLFTHPPTPGFL